MATQRRLVLLAISHPERFGAISKSEASVSRSHEPFLDGQPLISKAKWKTGRIFFFKEEKLSVRSKLPMSLTRNVWVLVLKPRLKSTPAFCFKNGMRQAFYAEKKTRSSRRDDACHGSRAPRSIKGLIWNLRASQLDVKSLAYEWERKRKMSSGGKKHSYRTIDFQSWEGPQQTIVLKKLRQLGEVRRVKSFAEGAQPERAES